MDPECNETLQEARYQHCTKASTPSPHPSLCFLGRPIGK